MIEYPVEAGAELVDGAIGKDVSLRHGHITTVVGDVLRAGKRTLLGKPRRTSRNEGCGLIVAEAGKDRILAGEIVIQADVELPLVKLPDGDVGIVVAHLRGVADVVLGIKQNHLLAGLIEHVGRNLVTGRAPRLHPTGTGRDRIL